MFKKSQNKLLAEKDLAHPSEVQLMEIGSPENSNGTLPVTAMGTEKQMETKQKMIKMIPHEIATQLGAKLSTLFALFVKMAVGGSVRPRQQGFNNARRIVKHIFSILEILKFV